MARIFLFVGLVVLASTSAYAQYQNTVFVPPYNPGLQLLNDSIRVRPSDDGDGNSGGSRNSLQNKADSPIISADLTFTPSAARTRKNLQTFADKSRAVNPAGAEQMEQLFASTDIIGQIGNAMRSIGLSRSNAADAYALYWISAWKATRGDNSSADAGTYQAVSAQAARGLSTSPEFANATEAQKQEMAEAMMVQAAMIDAHMENAAGNPQQLLAVAKAVAQGASAAGLELNKMELTAQGFAKADKTGAADSSDKATNPAADPKALAANTVANANNGGETGKSDTGKWAIIAAAGGAGLAGVFMLGKAMGKKG